jgi:hypothetical protein
VGRVLLAKEILRREGEIGYISGGMSTSEITRICRRIRQRIDE